MKFVNPSIEYWEQAPGLSGVWSQIAKATRVCYQSRVREGESDKEFVNRVIIRPCIGKDGKHNFDKMHGAMLEHGTVYLDIDSDVQTLVHFFEEDKYSQIAYKERPYLNTSVYVTTNMRVIVENGMYGILEDWLCKPTERHPKRYTFSVITDIGVTREMNRHRTFSIAEQSTRYCDFNKDKFGGELTFIKPSWIDDDNIAFNSAKDTKCLKEYCDIISQFGIEYHQYTENYLTFAYYAAMWAYQHLRKDGWKPEQARQVLPLGLKTQAVYTAFENDWEHFLRLRADNVSGKVHPNMAVVANMIKDKFKEITNK